VEVSTLSLLHKKTYSKRAKRLAKSRVLVEDQQIGKTTTEIEDLYSLKNLFQRSLLTYRVPLKMIPPGTKFW
jgi:hypothetical protein